MQNLNSDESLRYAHQLQATPVLTSYDAGWNSASLEYLHLPAGETPKSCLDHYLIAIYFGKGSHYADLQVEGIAQGRSQRQIFSDGSMALVPMKHSNQARWEQQIEVMMLNLDSDLLIRNAAEVLDVDQVELLPYTQLYDSLILQIGLTLKADLESHKLGGRLYAETLTNALAVHLLRNYSFHNSCHNYKLVSDLGGLSPTQLRRVTDYINDHLDQELKLEELAGIAQLSAYHFCRAFKRSTGFTPHQYVIRQRVERAKLMLKGGKMSIVEVAIACGFTHQSHLNRHFKRLTGVTPKIFSKS